MWWCVYVWQCVYMGVLVLKKKTFIPEDKN